MQILLTPYVGGFVIAALVSTALAAYCWRQHATPLGLALYHMVAAATLWSATLAVQAALVEPRYRVIAAAFEYIPVNSAPLFLLQFALHFAGRGPWLTPRRRALLWVFPVIHVLMAFTNPWHHLLWSHFTPGLPGTNLMVYHRGPWLWVTAATGYAYNLAASVLIVQRALQPGALARGQAAAVMAGLLLPWAANLAYILDLVPIPGLEIIPVAFTFTALALAYGIHRYGLLDLIPVARSTLIETMPDGALVFDAQGRLADLNPAAREALRLGLGELPTPLLGQPMSALLRFRPAGDDGAARASGHAEVRLGDGDDARIYDAQLTPLRARDGALSGYLALLRDVTERARAEQALRESESRFRRMAEHLPFPLLLSRARDRKLLYGNPRAVALFNGGNEAPIGDGAAYFDDPGDREAIWEELGRSGAVSGRELRLRRPDQTPIWALFSAVVTEMGGEPVALSALADITARKEAETGREALAAQLQGALASVKTLSGLVPICAHCKKIRDDAGYWQAVEQYVSEHSQAQFTHGICPDCMNKFYRDYLEGEESRSTSQAPHFLKPSPPARPQAGAQKPA